MICPSTLNCLFINAYALHHYNYFSNYLDLIPLLLTSIIFVYFQLCKLWMNFTFSLSFLDIFKKLFYSLKLSSRNKKHAFQAYFFEILSLFILFAIKINILQYLFWMLLFQLCLNNSSFSLSSLVSFSLMKLDHRNHYLKQFLSLRDWTYLSKNESRLFLISIGILFNLT